MKKSSLWKLLYRYAFISEFNELFCRNASLSFNIVQSSEAALSWTKKLNYSFVTIIDSDYYLLYAITLMNTLAQRIPTRKKYPPPKKNKFPSFFFEYPQFFFDDADDKDPPHFF